MSSYSDVCKNATIKTPTKSNNDLNLFKENARRINEKQKTMLKQRLTRRTLSTLSFRRQERLKNKPMEWACIETIKQKLEKVKEVRK
ncbi:hypothetical protein EG65_02410 [Helicobacter pylori J166]|nr:hypothetical protein EG65_02410 [Helicobacter pylori J166]